MKVYVIVKVDMYSHRAELYNPVCFKSIDKAIEHLQFCYDNYEDKPKYVLFEIRELEVKK